MQEYPKDQIWKIYEKLPEELKDAIFSEETTENIANVCEANGIKDERQISLIGRFTGHVLLGLIHPDEFQNVLEKEVGLERDTIKKVSYGIYRFVFFPVKESLATLYQMEIKPPGFSETPLGEKSAEVVSQPKKSSKKDVYREMPE